MYLHLIASHFSIVCLLINCQINGKNVFTVTVEKKKKKKRKKEKTLGKQYLIKIVSICSIDVYFKG